MSKYIPKKHYRDSVRWPDGVRRDIPTCMVERRDLPDGEFLMTDNPAKCSQCGRVLKPRRYWGYSIIPRHMANESGQPHRKPRRKP